MPVSRGTLDEQEWWLVALLVEVLCVWCLPHERLSMWCVCACNLTVSVLAAWMLSVRALLMVGVFRRSLTNSMLGTALGFVLAFGS